MRGRKQDGLGPSDRLVMRREASRTQVTAARCTCTYETNQSECQAFPFFSKKIWLFPFVARRFFFVVSSARRSIVPRSVPQPLVAAAARSNPTTRPSSNTAIHMYANASPYPISMFGCSWSIHPSPISVVSLVRILNYSSMIHPMKYLFFDV